MFADQPRRHLLDEFEPRPPHQGAVAEHPEVAAGQFCFGYDFGWHGGEGYQNLRPGQNGLIRQIYPKV